MCVQPAVIVERMIELPLARKATIELTGRSFVLPVSMSIELICEEVETPLMKSWIWAWCFTIPEVGWSMTQGCGAPSAMNAPPDFNVAIVTFGQLWRTATNTASRISLSNEFKRLKSIVDAYDEDWWVGVREQADPNNFGEFQYSGAWSERDIKLALKHARAAWEKTPEGFFDARARARAKSKRQKKSKT